MKSYVAMHRTFLMIAAFAALAVGGMTLAQHAQHTGKSQVKVTQLSQREIIEKLDGKDANSTVKVVTFEPGQEDSPHRHTGPVFGYVQEGEYEHALDDEPVKKYKAGDTFYEPSGSFHRVARNPSGKTRTRLLVVVLHSRDTKETTIPEKGSVATAAEGPRRAAFGETVTRLAERPVPNIPGKRLVVDAVDYVPGGYSASHRHERRSPPSKT